MSATPPDNGPTRSNSAGDGVGLGVTDARGAMRTGRNIWILVISLALAVVVVLGYWVLHAPHLNALNDAKAARTTQNATGYPVQDASPRESPAPNEPPAAGNTQ
jgi:hypothetical protein